MTLQERARAGGLSQASIAEMLGYTPDGVSRAIRRDPPAPAIVAALTAWEIMSVEQRVTWLAVLGVPQRRGRGRPRKTE